MKGLFVVDESRRKEYGRLKRNRTMKIMGITFLIWFMFTILNISMHTDLEVDVLLTIIFVALLVFGFIFGIVALIGANDIYDMMSLEINETGIIRKGGTFRQTEILFDQIDSIQVDSLGILIIKKGFANRLLFRHLRMFWNTARSTNLIYIPCKMENYEEIKKNLIKLSDTNI